MDLTWGIFPKDFAWAWATAVGALTSLSDSSSLLLSEVSPCFPAWVAVGPIFPWGAGAVPFPEGPADEAALA